MPITNNQLKLIWVAKTKLGMRDDVFRSALVEIAGVSSTKELDTEGFQAVMAFFEFAGFRPGTPKGRDYGHRPGMASFAQIELIRVLWREYTRNQTGEDALNTWLEHYWKISSLRFLRKETAPRIITALKSMKARAA